MRTRSPRLPLPRIAAIASLLLAFAATADAQAPKRRGKPEAIRTAGAAFVEAVGGVSRNKASFTQDVLLNGCEVSVTTRRTEKADSLVEMHLFDAGNLTARSAMTIDGTTGAIMFRFPTVNAAANVSRTRLRTVNVAAGSTAAPVEEKARVAELLLLVANTSRQPDAQAFLTAWIDFVTACGGDPST